MSEPLNFPYCSGCSHSRLQALLVQVLEPWKDRVMGVCGAGCSSAMGEHFPLPVFQADPGQAPAMAMGLKRQHPDHLVFTYQGDGDLAARGFDVLMHTAIQGESLTVICLNNLVMAGSGGQMSPTTLTGQITTSTRMGRSASRSGKPLKLAEFVGRLPEVAFSQRISLHSPTAVRMAEQALKDAFLFQENGQGLSFIEVLGWCPPYWDRSPTKARDYLEQHVLKALPPGIYRNQGLRP